MRLLVVAVALLVAALAAPAVLRALADRQERSASAELEQTVAAADERVKAAVAGARATAIQMAADPGVAKVLTTRSAAPPPIVRRHPEAAVLDVHGVLRAGRRLSSPFVSVAKVSVGGVVVGSVRVTAPFAPVAAAASAPYRLVLVRPVPGLTAGRVTTIDYKGTRVRALGQNVGGRMLLAFVPHSSTAPERSTKVLVWIAAAASWLTIALLLAPGRSRLRQGTPSPETLRLFGEALAATHDPRSLIAAFLRIAVETTGAAGGAVDEDGTILEQIGAATPVDISVPLPVKGALPKRTLVLTAPPEGFSTGALGRVHALALQASAALTNAHLHEVASERSQTDELTSLANRRHLVERLEAELGNTPLSVIAADLDNFKSVNDRFGHQAGDRALRHFAGVIGLYSREADVPARVGGDEFIVLLPNTDEAGAGALGERIRAATAASRLVAVDGRTFAITTSVGVATVTTTGLSVEAILARADGALYRAKASGRNAVVATKS